MSRILDIHPRGEKHTSIADAPAIAGSYWDNFVLFAMDNEERSVRGNNGLLIVPIIIDNQFPQREIICHNLAANSTSRPLNSLAEENIVVEERRS